jgi:hypothetical protein
MSSVQPLLDAAGRRRSPATTPGFRAGIAPRNKGQRYPADPPTVNEIVAVMRQAGRDRHGHRLNALIVVLWRAGLRVHEAEDMAPSSESWTTMRPALPITLCRSLRKQQPRISAAARSKPGSTEP